MPKKRKNRNKKKKQPQKQKGQQSYPRGKKGKRKYEQRNRFETPEDCGSPNEQLLIVGKGKKQYKKNKKGQRKLSRYEQDKFDLSAVLNPLGMYIKTVNSDGNCLWRSVADQLENDENRYNFYKNQTIKFIAKNKEYFAPYVLKDFDTYIKEIKSKNEWGDDICLFAFSRAFDKNVVVHQNGKANLEFHNGKKEENSIHLAYHLQEHYNSVRKNRNFKDEFILRKKDKEGEKKKKKKKKSLIDDNTMKFIMGTTGCVNEKYIINVFKNNFLDANETVQVLLMERNVYEVRGVKENDYWKDVVVPEDSDDEEVIDTKFQMVNTQKKLSKREKRELDKKKKREEHEKRKANYLSRKQKKIRASKEKIEKEMERIKKEKEAKLKKDQPVTHIETIQI